MLLDGHVQDDCVGKISFYNRRQKIRLRQQISQAKTFKNIGWLAGMPGGRLWVFSRTKRIFDFLFGLCATLILSPVFIFIALLIKLDSEGPVFFLQERTGFRGRRFTLYKFRTMVNNSEAIKEQYSYLNRHSSDSPDFKIAKDPRVTRIGNYLRKYSLDELPNFFNVLLGHLSLVGPRPTSFNTDVYKKKHLVRLTVPPGITGLWQVLGRSDIDFSRRVIIDLYYIKNQGPLLDLKIILMTFLRIFDGKGAY